MAHRDHYDAGIPSWVDLMSPDVDASKAFYTGLFGWEAEDQLDGEGNRIYVQLRQDGRDVAGMGGQAPEMEGMPPIWNTYVATDDCDATVKKAEAAGGTVMMPTMEVMDAGKMAILADPSGAMVSVWQAGEHIGAGIVNEPNSFSWNELMTRDLEAVKPFYAEVFGWEYETHDMGEMGPYTTGQIGGDDIAGLMTMPPDIPDEVPSYWNVYFAVADADAICKRVEELGGQVLWGPEDTPVGKLATIQDPQGGSFSIMQHQEGYEA